MLFIAEKDKLPLRSGRKLSFNDFLHGIMILVGKLMFACHFSFSMWWGQVMSQCALSSCSQDVKSGRVSAALWAQMFRLNAACAVCTWRHHCWLDWVKHCCCPWWCSVIGRVSGEGIDKLIVRKSDVSMWSVFQEGRDQHAGDGLTHLIFYQHVFIFWFVSSFSHGFIWYMIYKELNTLPFLT